MKQEQSRRMLLNQYHSYLAILQQRGLSYETLSDEEIDKLSDPELGNLNRQLRDIARTPGDGR